MSVATASGAPAAETPEDFGGPPTGLARRWVAEIEAFERERAQWVERVEKISARYRGEAGKRKSQRQFALLWSNIEVLKPTIYARDPEPRVFRRFRDRDPVGKVAGQLMERVLSCQIERSGSYGEAARAAVLDYLISGQGAAWVYYEPTFGPDATAVDERARLAHVHWRDFGFTAGARIWDEVTAVWRCAYMTREQLRARFGEAGENVPLDRKPAEAQDDRRGDAEVIGKATIYEIWDSVERQTIWLHKGVAEPLDARPYPLRLRCKFPCPRPMFGTLTTGSTVPVPDFTYYQDQALELDDLTARIAALAKALKLIGFVAGDSAADIQKGLTSAQEVAFVPVEAWVAGKRERPMDNAIAWLPVREVAETMARLLEVREQVKRDAYEITGLSDILRGQTEAQETATAQQIKAQWGGIRVREKQAEVARFCRDAIEIMADVVCGHFDPERIASEANAEAMPANDQPHVVPALELLKGPNALRAYRIDVETDSTIAPDEAGEREAATELLTGISSYLGAMMPILQGVQAGAPQALPAMAEMVGGLLVQAVRRFRGGEDAEDLVERAMQSLAQPAAPAGPAGPPPEQIAAEADMAKAQMQAQTQLQLEAQKAAAAREIEAMKLAAQREIEAMKLAAEDRRHEQKLAIEGQKLAADVTVRQMESEATREMERERMAADAQTREREAVLSKPDPDPRIDGLAQAVGTIADQVGAVAQRLEAVAEEMAAPVEIVRGADGRATEMRRGSRVLRVRRGSDGRAEGLN